ncbi:MAG: 2Fe-2S iron-sulfur cluster-binding protein [Lachnospiraceae bacterium]
MRIKILRQKDRESLPFYQEFAYNGERNITVAALLDYLNYHDDLFDAEGKVASRIRWECSCQQKMCGACAMVINGVPALACDVFLKELKIKNDTITLKPLSKFPVIADLIVDRSIIFDNLVESGLWLDDRKPPEQAEYAHQYTAAKCLKCGICLEVCPNYRDGTRFFGAAIVNETYLTCSQNSKNAHQKKMRESYQKHFMAGCSKSLACERLCPVKMKTLSSICKLQRKI